MAGGTNEKHRSFSDRLGKGEVCLAHAGQVLGTVLSPPLQQRYDDAVAIAEVVFESRIGDAGSACQGPYPRPVPVGF